MARDQGLFSRYCLQFEEFLNGTPWWSVYLQKNLVGCYFYEYGPQLVGVVLMKRDDFYQTWTDLKARTSLQDSNNHSGAREMIVIVALILTG